MKRLEKSTFPRMRPKGGIRMSPTSDVMIFPNAAPMMMPTAMSSTLPRIANSLNSLNMSCVSLRLDLNFNHAEREGKYSVPKNLSRGLSGPAKRQHGSHNPANREHAPGDRERHIRALKRKERSYYEQDSHNCHRPGAQARFEAPGVRRRPRPCSRRPKDKNHSQQNHRNGPRWNHNRPRQRNQDQQRAEQQNDEFGE